MQKIKITFLFALLSLLAPIQESFTEELTPESWLKWDDVNDFYKDRLMASLHRNEGVVKVFQPREQSSSQMVSFWKGNNPEVELDLEQIILEFSYWKDEQEHTQNYKIDLSDKSIVVLPEPAYLPTHEKGIRFKTGAKESFLGFIDGRPGLILFAVENHTAESRLLGLCPRYPGASSQSANAFPSTFLQSHSRPVSLTGSVSGFGKASLENLRGVSYARIQAEVTPNLPRSRVEFDTVKSRSPQVSLLYRPSKESEFDVKLDHGEQIPLGIRFFVELESPAGYRRYSSFSRTAWHWMEEFAEGINFEYNGVKIVIAPGLCSMILLEKRKYEIFSKSEAESAE